MNARSPNTPKSAPICTNALWAALYFMPKPSFFFSPKVPSAIENALTPTPSRGRAIMYFTPRFHSSMRPSRVL